MRQAGLLGGGLHGRLSFAASPLPRKAGNGISLEATVTTSYSVSRRRESRRSFWGGASNQWLACDLSTPGICSLHTLKLPNFPPSVTLRIVLTLFTFGRFDPALAVPSSATVTVHRIPSGLDSSRRLNEEARYAMRRRSESCAQ